MLAFLLPLIGNVLTLVQQQTSGKVSASLSTAATLEGIVAVALAAYRAEVGQEMDLAKLKPYVPLVKANDH